MSTSAPANVPTTPPLHATPRDHITLFRSPTPPHPAKLRTGSADILAAPANTACHPHVFSSQFAFPIYNPIHADRLGQNRAMPIIPQRHP